MKAADDTLVLTQRIDQPVQARPMLGKAAWLLFDLTVFALLILAFG